MGPDRSTIDVPDGPATPPLSSRRHARRLGWNVGCDLAIYRPANRRRRNACRRGLHVAENAQEPRPRPGQGLRRSSSDGCRPGQTFAHRALYEFESRLHIDRRHVPADVFALHEYLGVEAAGNSGGGGDAGRRIFLRDNLRELMRIHRVV